MRYQVKCDAGIADIVTPDAIYEVKPDIRYPAKLYEAIGQVLIYHQLINPSTEMVIVGYAFAGRGHSHKQLQSIQLAASKCGVRILFWEKEQ